MSRCRFVAPEVVRLSLSEGDWIDVKKLLNVGEQRTMFSRMYRDVEAADGSPSTRLNLPEVGKSRVSAYVVGWSLLDAAGHAAPVTDSAIDALDLDSFGEILSAVDAHLAREEESRVTAKKSQGGESALPAISTSAA